MFVLRSCSVSETKGEWCFGLTFGILTSSRLDLRVKADEASFDCGMLSVTSSAQFLAFFLPVNCFCSVSWFKRSSIRFKLGEKLDLYTSLSSSVDLEY